MSSDLRAHQQCAYDTQPTTDDNEVEVDCDESSLNPSQGMRAHLNRDKYS